MGNSEQTAVNSCRIVFVNQFFWPDNAPTAILLDQTARYAASQGHEVTVICGRHGYAAGGASAPPAVRICRVPSFRFARNPVSRLLSWGSFLLLAALRLLWLERCDIVVVMTTPPGLSIASALLKRHLGAKLWIWEMDVYPDVVIATGGLAGSSLLARILHRVFTWSRRRADGIIALGECMQARLTASGVPANRIHIAHNWADDQQSFNLVALKSPPLRLLYSGNLGMAHEVETLGSVLLLLASEKSVHFVFAGGGVARPGLEASCREAGADNVTFQAYGDTQTFNENLRNCHLGLVTLRDGCQGTVVPSKVYSLLSAGRPILFIGPKDATPAILIREHQCGWQFDPGAALEISSFLRSLSQNPHLAAEAGARARRAFELHFTRSHGTERVLRTLLSCPC